MSGKFALVIGNTEYNDSGLAQLSAPGKDAEDFARVLESKDICGFDDVKILVNQPSSSVIEEIDEFFDQKKPDDLLILYFSGHGVKDEIGSLYLAFKNTVRSRLRSTAIKSDYIREAMDQSRSKRQVLILDCCNSGAFPQGTKAETGGAMGMAKAFQGYGRFVLTASDATQFAWEGDKFIGETDNSLFTHFLVKGLEGEADSDGDGKITVDEIYDYAYQQISKVTPKQTPTKSSSKQEGEIILRENMRIEDIKPMALPDDLTNEIEDTRPYVREIAVQKLEKILKGKNIGLARSAREALEKIAEDENSTRRVARAATLVLDSLREEQKADEERRAREKAERLATLKTEAERKTREEAEKFALAKAERETAECKATRIKAEDEKAKKEGAERKADRQNAKQEAPEFEAIELVTRRKAGQDVDEKAMVIPESTASLQPNPQRQPILKWVIIGIMGLCAIVTGLGVISYLASLGGVATPAPPPASLGSVTTPVSTEPPSHQVAVITMIPTEYQQPTPYLQVVFENDFSSFSEYPINPEGEAVGEIKISDDPMADIVNGEYQLHMDQGGYAPRLIQSTQGDFRVSFDVRIISATDKEYSGWGFDIMSNQGATSSQFTDWHSVLFIDPNSSTFDVSQTAKDYSVTNIISKTYSEAIRAGIGESNHVVVEGINNIITVRINEQIVVVFDHSTQGLIHHPGWTVYNLTEVGFDNLVVEEYH